MPRGRSSNKSRERPSSEQQRVTKPAREGSRDNRRTTRSQLQKQAVLYSFSNVSMMSAEIGKELDVTRSSSNQSVPKNIRARRKRRKTVPVPEPKYAGARNSPDASTLPSPPSQWLVQSDGLDTDVEMVPAEDQRNTNASESNREAEIPNAEISRKIRKRDSESCIDLAEFPPFAITSELKKRALSDFESFTAEIVQYTSASGKPQKVETPRPKAPKCMANFSNQKPKTKAQSAGPPKKNSSVTTASVDTPIEIRVPNQISAPETKPETPRRRRSRRKLAILTESVKSEAHREAEPNFTVAVTTDTKAEHEDSQNLPSPVRPTTPDRAAKCSGSKTSSSSARRRRRRAKTTPSICLQTRER